MTSDPFFMAGNQIVQSKRIAQNSGRHLGRWQDHGVMLGPSYSAAARNALCVPMPTVEDWEKESILYHDSLRSESPEPKPKSMSTKTIVINRN